MAFDLSEIRGAPSIGRGGATLVRRKFTYESQDKRAPQEGHLIRFLEKLQDGS